MPGSTRYVLNLSVLYKELLVSHINSQCMISLVRDNLSYCIYTLHICREAMVVCTVVSNHVLS
jgi:hypothetical protein